MVEMQKNKVVVVGLGYVGLPLMCEIASCGMYMVCGFDLDEEKISKISQKVSPIDDERVQEQLKNVDFVVSNDESIVEGAEYVIICVPTPVREDKSPNLGPVQSASRMAAKYLQRGQTVIIESTINPGVCEEVVLPILEESGLKAGVDVELSHCPERVIQNGMWAISREMWVLLLLKVIEKRRSFIGHSLKVKFRKLVL